MCEGAYAGIGLLHRFESLFGENVLEYVHVTVELPDLEEDLLDLASR